MSSDPRIDDSWLGGGSAAMKTSKRSRRRPAVHITLERAARLHRLVALLGAGPQGREALLATLGIGLRTFYRELELLRRRGVKVRLVQKQYVLHGTVPEAEGRLPFPDPQLSFAEMAELARCPGPVAQRLAEMLAGVVEHAPPESKAQDRKSRRTKRSKSKAS
jgi:predicted DNA-binding transcriptional regulator YafY